MRSMHTNVLNENEQLPRESILKTICLFATACWFQIGCGSGIADDKVESKLAPMIPIAIEFQTDEKATLLDDHSIHFEGAVGFSSSACTFVFQKPGQLSAVTFQILPNPVQSKLQLGRYGNKKLFLFDLKPSLIHNRKAEAIEFYSCTWQKPRRLQQDQAIVDHLESTVDYLSDTGLEIPSITKKDQLVELKFTFRELLQFDSGDKLVLEIDAGGSPELDLFSRVRFLMPAELEGFLSKPDRHRP